MSDLESKKVFEMTCFRSDRFFVGPILRSYPFISDRFRIDQFFEMNHFQSDRFRSNKNTELTRFSKVPAIVLELVFKMVILSKITPLI